MPVKKVSKILREVGRLLGANPSKLDYLRQYLFAGCEVGVVNDELVYVCDRKTVDSLLENLTVLNVERVEEKDGFDKFLNTTTKLIRTLLKALKVYIVKHNLDYKSGVVTVSIKNLKRLFEDKSYKNLALSTLQQKLVKMVIERGTPRPLVDNGLNFKIVGKEVFVDVDLDKFKRVLDKI